MTDEEREAKQAYARGRRAAEACTALRDFPFGGDVVVNALAEMLAGILVTDDQVELCRERILARAEYPGPDGIAEIAREIAVPPEFALEPPPPGVCRSCRGTGYRIERLICDYCSTIEYGIRKPGKGCLRCQHGYHAEPVRCECSPAPAPAVPPKQQPLEASAGGFTPITASDFDSLDREQDSGSSAQNRIA